MRSRYATLRNGELLMQQAIDFGRDHRVSEAERGLLRILNDAVDALGLMVAAGACGCRTQDLSDALSGRSNRYLRIGWVMAIADISSPDMQRKVSGALVGWLGFEVKDARPLDDRTARLELEAALKSLGPVGEQKLRDVYGGRR